MKVLQKQLAMAMKEMIENTGTQLEKKMETLRQILNFSMAMCKKDKPEAYAQLAEIKKNMSILIRDDYKETFEDPEVVDSKDEMIFRMLIEDLHGDASYVINEEKLIPAWLMEFERVPGSDRSSDQVEVL